MDVFFEASAQCRGAGCRVGVHYSLRLNTIVCGVNADGYILSAQKSLQCHENLPGQAFLYLRTLPKETHNAIDFG